MTYPLVGNLRLPRGQPPFPFSLWNVTRCHRARHPYARSAVQIADTVRRSGHLRAGTCGSTNARSANVWPFTSSLITNCGRGPKEGKSTSHRGAGTTLKPDKVLTHIVSVDQRHVCNGSP